MAAKNGQSRIGTSGWQYRHWDRVFYPEQINKNEWFDYFSQHFDTVEINNTFYNLPQAQTFDHWRDKCPAGFRYALKYSRFGTHIKRLREPDEHIATFLKMAERLKSHLGPILVQLPPHWYRRTERLEAFLETAPGRHRWAVEFRDPDWLCEEVYGLLRKHHAALVLHDMIEDHPEEVTTDWVYLRYHGKKYRGSYSPQKLSAEADKIAHWLGEGLDVYAYFNNDARAHAVFNAKKLKEYVDERMD